MIEVAHPIIGDEERIAVDRVLASGLIAQGPEVEAFEDEFASVSETTHCIAVNSGTSALHLGLLAAGVGPGDEVIVPSFTFAATANSVALAGATPVFADIDADTFCIDPVDVERKITAKTKAIMPVHLYGQAADLSSLSALAKAAGVDIYEDAAQAHLATFEGRRVGGFGSFGAFSFYPTKNMTAGEGGMITTDDPEIARRARLLRNQGMARRYENELVGFNSRMTDLHAAIGRVQLRKLAQWTEQRQKNAAQLSAAISSSQVSTPVLDPRGTHAFHQYTIRVPRRDEFQSLLRKRGVGSGVYYPTPIHRLPSFNLELELPVTQSSADSVLSLPVHPALSEGDLETVIAAVKDVAEICSQTGAAPESTRGSN